MSHVAPDKFVSSDGQAVLKSLLGNVSVESFLSDYWEKKHLYVKGGSPNQFDALFSPQNLDEFLSRNDVRYPSISMVKDGAARPLSEYSRPLKIGTYLSEGLIDMDRVFKGYSNGQTIILQLMQNGINSLAEFCAKLSVFFRCKVDAHGFLTPANSQGLSAHYDTASAFLIQLKGAKRWRLYDLAIDAPCSEQTFDSRNPIKGAPIDEIVLNAGDVLYLPRGLPHEGLALKSESLHLTVVLFPKTWLEILGSALAVCEVNDEEFRKAPPELFGESGMPELKNNLAVFAAKLRDHVPQENLKGINLTTPNFRRGRWIKP